MLWPKGPGIPVRVEGRAQPGHSVLSTAAVAAIVGALVERGLAVTAANQVRQTGLGGFDLNWKGSRICCCRRRNFFSSVVAALVLHDDRDRPRDRRREKSIPAAISAVGK
jgi:hypothetical protein